MVDVFVFCCIGPLHNYASYYSRRARNPYTCPRDTRIEEWEEPTLPHGTTSFRKIRIMIHSLQVIGKDIFSLY